MVKIKQIILMDWNLNVFCLLFYGITMNLSKWQTKAGKYPEAPPLTTLHPSRSLNAFCKTASLIPPFRKKSFCMKNPCSLAEEPLLSLLSSSKGQGTSARCCLKYLPCYVTIVLLALGKISSQRV